MRNLPPPHPSRNGVRSAGHLQQIALCLAGDIRCSAPPSTLRSHVFPNSTHSAAEGTPTMPFPETRPGLRIRCSHLLRGGHDPIILGRASEIPGNAARVLYPRLLSTLL
ncbi:hypothetical protein JHW43_000934 [Diplocarpon mali]|nr:hypothetical protein JHW43_000934 [Diplocarpon mali]